MLNYLSRCNVNVEIVRVEFDRTHFDAKWIVSETERVVRHYGGRFDLAIVDAIASVPCFVLPFQELTRMFQSYGNSYISENGIDSVWLGIPVLVDAAHAAGQIPIRLDTDSFRPDFFITNIHKWMYAARGCAVLYIDRRWHEYMVPTVVSAGYHNGQGSLRDRFRWVGTGKYGFIRPTNPNTKNHLIIIIIIINMNMKSYLIVEQMTIRHC
jgi:selenocysteine lyase/cysteine desulfurase